MTACSDNTAAPAEAALARPVFKEKSETVQVAKVTNGVFQLEILSNGKALAVNYADVRFALNETITEVLVKNGDFVKQGQLLAVLDNADVLLRQERRREAIEKARIELDDRLIDYGYRLKDSAAIPADIMRMARIRCGYNNAFNEYTDARLAVEKTRILAPFAGKVANMEAKVFNKPDMFKRLCTLIDDARMEVEFTVLENEFRFVTPGTGVQVSPFGSELLLPGKVQHINPAIDASGMIRVSAIVENPAGKLINGMNVKVLLQKPVPDKIFVPREAVVQRDGRQVVFTYEKGQAKWNYVVTGLQNTKSICIQTGLQPGQEVITTNNIHLAHNAQVQLAVNH